MDLLLTNDTRMPFVEPGTNWPGFLRQGLFSFTQMVRRTQEGELLRQPDLARTYRAIAENGPEWFYGGPFAASVEKWMKANHGVMTASDLKSYRAVIRAAISTDFRSYTVISFPPPSSGGVHLLEMLNMLETRPFRILGLRNLTGSISLPSR